MPPKKVKITQKDFEQAVQENINDLGLDEVEAIEEAFKQFEVQGADLSGVSKKSAGVAGSQKLGEIKLLIKNIKEKSKAGQEFTKEIQDLKLLCDEDISNRVAAGNEGAYTVLLKVLNDSINNSIKTDVLKALTSLMTKNPDLLDIEGVKTIISFLKKNEESIIKRLTLKWAKQCCVMQEKNRQCFMENDIVAHIKELLETSESEIQKEVMSLMRALVLDDDVRVEFGNAHEAARIIASETLCSLTALMNKNQNDEKLVFELMNTISALMVRSEFCQKVETAGGLELIKKVLTLFSNNEKIVKQSYKLIKALAGNDEVKKDLLQSKNIMLAPIIFRSLDNHKGNPSCAAAGLSAIAALTLRSPENSKILFNAGLPETIVEIMKLYPNDKTVQKSGSWAIRNMVSRSRDQCGTFLSFGVEEVLQENLIRHKDFEYDTKAALRDLGCKVILTEQWTGKGGALTTKKTIG
ncbi:unnamed protein product [Brassicogethes aeneus]|uniref:Armadillo repeat-containing protein 6 homolog n=1 Tax=Brassicogethes aeneus TaxID=1431903 RepID=A0A9P0FE58_BRAAE|nr:unnamed protein product [Brassicogethes aeneus]